MALRRCTTAIQQGALDIKVGDIYDSTSYPATAYPSSFSAAISTDGADTATGKATLANFSFGEHEVITIASGVATITKSHVWLAAESGTADQLDTLTKADAADGDIVLLVADTGDTITVDDANIDLGAATRAIAPGGSMILRYDGTSWAEVTFLAGADNT